MERSYSPPGKTDKFWTQEKCVELIRLYRENLVLWDSSHPKYYAQPKKVEAWNKIGEQLNVPSSIVKGKMNVLLSSFRREKAKVGRYGEKGKIFYKSNWFGFKELSFLLTKEHNRNKAKALEINMHPRLPVVRSIELNSNCQGKAEDKPLPAKPQTNVQTSISMPFTSQAPNQPDTEKDEIAFFTNFLASKMKKYSEYTKNAVQKAICEIIFKADQNLYEQAACDSTSVGRGVPTTSALKRRYSSETSDDNSEPLLEVKTGSSPKIVIDGTSVGTRVPRPRTSSETSDYDYCIRDSLLRVKDESITIEIESDEEN